MEFKKGDLVQSTQTHCLLPPRDTVPRTGLRYYGPGNCWGEVNAWVENDYEQYLVPLTTLSPVGRTDATRPGTHAGLERVFALAVAQTRDGKGADRHGNGQAFEDQPIVIMNQALGSNHGALFQAVKKLNESARLAATDRVEMAKAELLGAMVYAGAAYLLLEGVKDA